MVCGGKREYRLDNLCKKDKRQKSYVVQKDVLDDSKGGVQTAERKQKRDTAVEKA